MNHLVGRLGLLRHELKIDPVVPTDLNSVVTNALAVFEEKPGTGGNLSKKLGALSN